jgi:TM2 domain-containing membrane protein YozV
MADPWDSNASQPHDPWGPPEPTTQVPYVQAYAPPPPPPPPYQPLGYAPPVMYGAYGPPKSKMTAALLAFFLGGLGIHNFYLGRTAIAVTQLLLCTVGGILTCGVTSIGVGIWAFVEFILILTDNVKDGNGQPLSS